MIRRSLQLRRDARLFKFILCCEIVRKICNLGSEGGTPITHRLCRCKALCRVARLSLQSAPIQKLFVRIFSKENQEYSPLNFHYIESSFALFESVQFSTVDKVILVFQYSLTCRNMVFQLNEYWDIKEKNIEYVYFYVLNELSYLKHLHHYRHHQSIAAHCWTYLPQCAMISSWYIVFIALVPDHNRV